MQVSDDDRWQCKPVMGHVIIVAMIGQHELEELNGGMLACLSNTHTGSGVTNGMPLLHSIQHSEYIITNM